MNTSLRIIERNVEIPSGAVKLPTILGLPEQARGAVLFAHGSGSGRLSRRSGSTFSQYPCLHTSRRSRRHKDGRSLG